MRPEAVDTKTLTDVAIARPAAKLAALEPRNSFRCQDVGNRHQQDIKLLFYNRAPPLTRCSKIRHVVQRLDIVSPTEKLGKS